MSTHSIPSSEPVTDENSTPELELQSTNKDSNSTPDSQPDIVAVDNDDDDDINVSGQADDNGRCRSDVWGHFTRKKIDGAFKAICNYCFWQAIEALMCAQSWLWAAEMKGEASVGYATIYNDMEQEDSCITRENSFVDSFPMGFGNVVGLIALNASGNNFSGYLPEDLGNAAFLESLDLRGNFFEGSIPKSFKDLGRLKFLGLSGNNLTGNIPTELGQLSLLESIVIGYNDLEGEIPAEFGNLTNLKYLDLDGT
ncbi:hypothetical protein POM88_004224 [Heracleum sosnowskyi]|uniref:Uncharacterized protein n=1 Tax=Heracleum sosnowskyi TaxID=360622 RepID=A0AAD8JHY7_9APIA|nr:hypothetical protein POM88_004224 [Heracleum sosnowskyi]